MGIANSELMRVFSPIILGYFLGSIPCGYIAGRIKGVDVTKEGFKKIGDFYWD
ncbi:glycerol-3-phosphate acyltransferase [candidate division WOR-3 bacterium]|nr:glycerol-3-phosphate acyltransferase [candidate division WOR-3 bacterium]